AHRPLAARQVLTLPGAAGGWAWGLTRLFSPLHDLFEHRRRPGGTGHDHVALVEQTKRSFRGPHPDACVRNVEIAYVLEHRAVVLVVAEADHAAGVFARDERGQRGALARLWRMHLDDLASQGAGQARAVEQRLKERKHLVAGHVGIAKMDRGTGRFNLEPCTRYAFEDPARIGVETIERLLQCMT